jgi:hypothetical protein
LQSRSQGSFFPFHSATTKPMIQVLDPVTFFGPRKLWSGYETEMAQLLADRIVIERTKRPFDAQVEACVVFRRLEHERDVVADHHCVKKQKHVLSGMPYGSNTQIQDGAQGILICKVKSMQFCNTREK